MAPSFSTVLERLSERYFAVAWARWVALAVFVTVSWVMVTKGSLSSIPYRIDLDVYRIGGQVWLSGGELYGTLPLTDIGAALPFTYPPIAAVLFSVLALMSLPVASLLFSSVSIVAFGVALALIVKHLTGWNYQQVVWATVPLVSVLMMCEPVVQTLNFGQINAFLFLLVVADVVLGRGKWWQGSLIGLAMAIKLTPAVFLVCFFAGRQWRALVVGVLSALFFTGLGFLAAPRDSLQYWTETLRDPSRIGELSYAGNQSLNGFLVRLGFDGSSAVWFFSCAVIGLSLLAVMWRLSTRGDDLTPMLLMGLYSLIASPVSWSHHWLWAIAAILVAFSWSRAQAGYLPLALSGVFIFLSHIVWWFPHRNGAHEELAWGAGAHLLGNAYTWWALAFMIVAAWRAFGKEAPRAAAQ